MLRVLNCAIRGSEICGLDILNAFQNFAMHLLTVCQGPQSRSGIYGDEDNILSLLVIEP
jgi:hypothetical protein